MENAPMTSNTRRYVLTGVTVVFILLLSYEALFRLVTANCGEVDLNSGTPKIYYSYDLMWHLPVLKTCFGFRTRLPLGKVRLSKGSGAYVDGGRFYYRLADGRLQDVTSQLTQHQK